MPVEVTVRWEQQFRQVLQDIVEQGKRVAPVQAGASASNRRNDGFIDLNNYQFTLKDPRDRILVNPALKSDLYLAVARFIYMISGSDQLDDISFYTDKVRGYSDDGLCIPGSNYGTRLFRPRPGLNQIKEAVERIKTDPGTRRAAAIIWQPEDAARESSDIPCAFGMSFYVRNGCLNTTTLMRSNAACRLLHWNIFEFTLIAELVSIMAGVPLGEYTQFAVSMHIFDSEMSRVRAVIQDQSVPCPAMTPMTPTDWSDLCKLAQFSSDLRAATNALTNFTYQDFLSKCDEFDPYWADFAKVLLAFSLFKNNLIRAGNHVSDEIQSESFRVVLKHRAAENDQEIAKLEENPILLESRAALVRASSKYPDLDLEQREDLWRDWSKQQEEDTAIVGARFRNEGVSEKEWERRIQALIVRGEQEQVQKALFSDEE
jgi:thymidylate synthase